MDERGQALLAPRWPRRWRWAPRPPWSMAWRTTYRATRSRHW
jgi:hypothetical protein